MSLFDSYLDCRGTPIGYSDYHISYIVLHLMVQATNFDDDEPLSYCTVKLIIIFDSDEKYDSV